MLGRSDERLRTHRACRRFVGCRRAAPATASAARTDSGLLRREAVVDRYLSAVNEVRILRVGSGHAVFLDADRMPIVESDLAIHAAAIDACGTGILLTAAQAVGERVVGGHVVHRGGRLVVPAAPGFAAVRREYTALIGHQEDDVRVLGIDPAFLIIVAAGGAANGRPGLAAILGAPED